MVGSIEREGEKGGTHSWLQQSGSDSLATEHHRLGRDKQVQESFNGFNYAQVNEAASGDAKNLNGPVLA